MKPKKNNFMQAISCGELKSAGGPVKSLEREAMAPAKKKFTMSLNKKNKKKF
jgi:hypothetical protein